jgi:hypothetical protein
MTTDNTTTGTVRTWCCATPITGPHTPDCPFEPRKDEPIDYNGLVIVGDYPGSTGGYHADEVC